MKKEFGKWLLDIAKYMVTVLLLSTIFADLNSPLMTFFIILIVILIMGVGLQLVKDSEDDDNKKHKKGKTK